jgi:hypothetical protein
MIYVRKKNAIYFTASMTVSSSIFFLILYYQWSLKKNLTIIVLMLKEQKIMFVIEEWGRRLGLIDGWHIFGNARNVLMLLRVIRISWCINGIIIRIKKYSISLWQVVVFYRCLLVFLRYMWVISKVGLLLWVVANIK